MSYGIIFIGRQGLNIEDFARYVEKHYLCDEYLVQVMLQIMSHNFLEYRRSLFQSTAYNKVARESIAKMRQSTQFLQYIARYKKLVLSDNIVCNGEYN